MKKRSKFWRELVLQHPESCINFKELRKLYKAFRSTYIEKGFKIVEVKKDEVLTGEVIYSKPVVIKNKGYRYDINNPRKI